MLITRKVIEDEFLRADKGLEHCWALLTDLKAFALNTENFIERFITFQDTLASMIFRLQTIRDQIIVEEKSIVTDKSKYKPDWFVNRLRLLARYKKGIDLVVCMAKAQGDAYAYFFYQNDLALLSEHYGHERVINHTAGIGERGELEFLKKVKQIEGNFTLFHGITNILRYGDFSFIDLKNLKVVHIGELKTSQIDHETLDLNLHLIKRKDAEVVPPKLPLTNPEMEKTRRGRQLVGIANFMIRGRNSTDPSTNLTNKSYADDVNILVKNTKLDAINLAQTSPGTAFCCLKFRRASLYTRIFKREYQDLTAMSGGKLAETAVSMVKRGSANNGIVIGQLLYNPDFSDKNTPGTVPIFWNPMDNAVLKRIYFVDCVIISLFNPAHLIDEIAEMGFTVESKYVPKAKEPKNPRKVIQRFDLFISYIMNYLLTENFVTDAVKEAVEYAKEKPLSQVSLRLQQHVDILK
ncbi:hypothetical protein [Mucilaginibacter panaciglaebae]|uniref:AIPR protein n=1 Tax=Mucilaginibacter panaciglaebae TaxID=502331 RepID=A0ABP7W9L0_9SPHI